MSTGSIPCSRKIAAVCVSAAAVPLAEWIERFGPVDKLPPGVPRPAPTLPVTPYRRAR